ncbi:putative uncharacterized protein DDB_G0271982, partial [Penaeus japonicus]|uniref:putative uncharacterized protein DDB_G0271982 n=1 Tax=Penaeus japonicus TaxID=27405 RepID=UPI001C70E1A9
REKEKENEKARERERERERERDTREIQKVDKRKSKRVIERQEREFNVKDGGTLQILAQAEWDAPSFESRCPRRLSAGLGRS